MVKPPDWAEKLIGEIGTKKIGGSSTKPGCLYHDLPFFTTKTHRKNTELRVQKILDVYDIKGKKGLDIGCSVGGISFRLQKAGAEMTGIDYDVSVMKLATTIEEKYQTGAKFIRCDFSFSLACNLVFHDFIIWFDHWMWLAKQKGEYEAIKVLKEVATKTNNLFFSTSQGDGQAKNRLFSTEGDVIELLKHSTDYIIVNLGTVNDKWHRRNIFWCHR